MWLLLDFGHSGIDPRQIRPGRGSPVRKFGDVRWRVDITKLLSLLCRCNKALIWLPFSRYVVAREMAKVEYYSSQYMFARQPAGCSLTPSKLSCRQKLAENAYLRQAHVTQLNYRQRFALRWFVPVHDHIR
jgi:hypothetical protein